MIDKSLDIAGNRTSIKYSNKEKIVRAIWGITHLFLFKPSPRTFFAWRRFLLRSFGATLGKEVNIYNSAYIYMPWNLEMGDWSAIGEWALIYNLGKVKIGEKTTISQRAHLCAGTHDYKLLTLPLMKQPIIIGSNAWICADAFIGPNVTIGDGVVVGARAVVVKHIEPWVVVGGNPAKVIKKRILNDETHP